MVEAVVNGKGELLRLNLDPEVVDPQDVEMLCDLVVPRWARPSAGPRR